MKYIFQQKSYDCAPVAVFNALRYFDKSIRYKTLSRIRRKMCTGKKDMGTTYRDFILAVRHFFNIKDIYHRPIDRNAFLKHLTHKPVFLQFPSVNGHGHMVFIERYLLKLNKFIVTNPNPRERKIKVSYVPIKEAHYCILIDSKKNRSHSA